MANMAEVILQCRHPQHCWSDTLRSSFAHGSSENLELVPSLCAKVSWNFIRHLATAVPLLEIDNISPVCRYIVQILSVLMACTWKNCVLLAAFWDRISIFHLGQTEHRSARGDGPLCAPHRALISFIWCSASEREKPGWIDWTSRFPPPHVEFCSVRSPRAPLRRSRFRVRHHTTYCARRSLSSYQPVMHTCCHFGANFRRCHMLRETARAAAGHSTFWRRTCQWVSHRAPPRLVALTSFTSYDADKRTQESELNRWKNRVFLILLGQSPPYRTPRWSQTFRRTICWLLWSIDVFLYETFGRKQIAVSSWNVSASCSLAETGPNLRTSLFVNRWLQITKLCTEANISILKQRKETLWVWEKNYRGMEFRPLGNILQNEMVSYAWR